MYSYHLYGEQYYQTEDYNTKGLIALFFLCLMTNNKNKKPTNYKVANGAHQVQESAPTYKKRFVIINRVLTDPSWSINENA